MSRNDTLTKPVNVSSVPQRSPFRYPGGKTWLVPHIRSWLISRPNLPHRFYEPFAGGGIVGLTVAFEGLADHVHLVELDDDVASVWRTILHPHDVNWLCEHILSFEVTRESVEQLLLSSPATTRELALQTVVKNRTYHGGILAKGSAPIRKGENGRGISSRWYPQTLVNRIRAIHSIRDRITFTHGDGMLLLQEHLDEADSAWFIDPPYSASGKRPGARLYTHYRLDHPGLFYLASNIAGTFLMTYDNVAEIRQFAHIHGFETELVAMSNRRNAQMTELLISENLDWARL